MEKKEDLISRQAAIEAVERAKTAMSTDGEIYCAKINAQMNIQLLPSAQPQRIRGKWVETERRGVLAGAKYYKCSICAQAIGVDDSTLMADGYNYCPRCGSQMREGQDG